MVGLHNILEQLIWASPLRSYVHSAKNTVSVSFGGADEQNQLVPLAELAPGGGRQYLLGL